MKFWKRLFKWTIIGDSCCGCYLKQTGGRCYRNVNTDLKQTNAYYYSLISFGCFFFEKNWLKLVLTGFWMYMNCLQKVSKSTFLDTNSSFRFWCYSKKRVREVNPRQAQKYFSVMTFVATLSTLKLKKIGLGLA